MMIGLGMRWMLNVVLMLLRMVRVSVVTLEVVVLLWPASVSARSADRLVGEDLLIPNFPRNFVRLTS